MQFRADFLRAAPQTTAEGIEKYLASGMIYIGLDLIGQVSDLVVRLRPYDRMLAKRKILFEYFIKRMKFVGGATHYLSLCGCWQKAKRKRGYRDSNKKPPDKEGEECQSAI